MDVALAPQRGATESRDGDARAESDWRVLIVERDSESTAALRRELALAGLIEVKLIVRICLGESGNDRTAQ